MQPIAYDFADPAEAIMRGIKMGATLDALQQQRQQQQAAQQQALQMRQDVQGVLMNPNAGHAEYAGLIMMYPSLHEPATKAFKMLDEAKRQNMLNFGSRVYSAFESGNPQLAEELLRDRVKAAANNPTQDSQQEAQHLSLMADLAKSGPAGVRTAQFMMASGLAAMSGLEKFQSTYTGLRKETREQEMQPTAVQQAVASAQKTEGEVAAQPEEAARTAAQRRQADATTLKLDAETRKLLAEADSAGNLDPTKQFQLESELRKEYASRTQTFQDMRESYRRIDASKDHATGDLSLIFGFMKMLDPGSVVREGEFANAQNAAGVPDRIQNIYNRVLKGERLTGGQRSMFKGQAASLLKSAEPREKEVRDGIAGIAKSYRLNTDNIFYPQERSNGGDPAGRQKLRQGVQSLLQEFGR